LDGRAAPPSGEPRREPTLVIERRPITISAPGEPAFDDEPFDDIEPEDDDIYVPGAVQMPRPMAGRPPQEPRMAPAPRVAAPAARPQPGIRAAREAQGSLLDEPGGFELPELSLLAAPRQKGISDEHRPQ